MSRLTEHDLRVAGMVSPLSGTAAKILCVFFLATVGQSFTGQDVADMLGVSANTVSPALRQLTRLGYLQYNGKLYGWSLISEYRQRSFTELIQENLDNTKIFGLTSLVSIDSDLNQESDLSNQLTTTSADNPKKLGLSPSTEEAEEVEHWLSYGGIDRNTPTWEFLVSKIATPELVKAHVLQMRYEHRAWEKANKSFREPGTGMLVHRLKQDLAGKWLTPSMRCEECLYVERDCHCSGRVRKQYIPDDLRDIIKR